MYTCTVRMCAGMVHVTVYVCIHHSWQLYLLLRDRDPNTYDIVRVCMCVCVCVCVCVCHKGPAMVDSLSELPFTDLLH